ncbi:MAG TPA: hypothetical protein VJ506_12000 [Candidatus Limnocylindrales bacterium]|nr:hypothetical protein [Candidatus Limnocylindrales bacterium]
MPSLRGMPWGVALFLAYAFILLAGIGLTLGYVVDLATEMAVSLPGVVDMVLLAYTIFTITLVLQRKAAARGLAIGMSSLIVPALLFAALGGAWPVAVFLAALVALLVHGLRRPATAAWLSEP